MPDVTYDPDHNDPSKDPLYDELNFIPLWKMSIKVVWNETEKNSQNKRKIINKHEIYNLELVLWFSIFFTIK
mgnify:CR=1 FL=1